MDVIQSFPANALFFEVPALAAAASLTVQHETSKTRFCWQTQSLWWLPFEEPNMDSSFAFGGTSYVRRWIFVPNSLNTEVSSLVCWVYSQLIHLQLFLAHFLFAFYVQQVLQRQCRQLCESKMKVLSLRQTDELLSPVREK